MYSSCNISKNHWNKFLPQRPHPLYFFLTDFQWNMLGDSINITDLCCNPVVLKKVGKTSWKLFFGPNLHKKGVIMGQTLNGKTIFFFLEITKVDHHLLVTFYFIKILCFDWVMNFKWCFFCQKMPFPAKTADTTFSLLWMFYGFSL